METSKEKMNGIFTKKGAQKDVNNLTGINQTYL